MKVLFLTLLDFSSINERNIYTDLLREFVKHGHFVYIISPVERRSGYSTRLIQEEKTTILKLKIGNVQKTNLIEKGISTVTLESLFIIGIKKFFSDIKFELVLYSTPPITLQRAVAYVKKRDNSETYLLLKDIFPQNAVDMGMLSKTGAKSLLYKYFRCKEKKLYALSDHIGCMSQANCDYVIEHNPEVKPNIVEVCPNSIEVLDLRINQEERNIIRKKYDISLTKKVFVYGGNLGKPQGIPFIKECLQSQLNNSKAFFLIIGDGTEYGSMEDFMKTYQPTNMKLMKRLPKEDYDQMIAACDVGMIYLDYRFTIPNFPSRLLSYMQAGLPVLACTDSTTDIGKVIVNGGFGWWCESNNVIKFCELIKMICDCNLEFFGNAGYHYLKDNYSSDKSYEVIIR